mmetsp:Transcript_730/g.2835  ORF Transcript_730/g.2835 Transcript_730/m.2835 type:complete len:228 (-) Transcript_730:709-1392(-)
MSAPPSPASCFSFPPLPPFSNPRVSDRSCAPSHRLGRKFPPAAAPGRCATSNARESDPKGPSGSVPGEDPDPSRCRRVTRGGPPNPHVSDPGTEQRKCGPLSRRARAASASAGPRFDRPARGPAHADAAKARVVSLHFFSTCCSHAALTICDWSSDTLLKLTYGTMSALDTRVVTNERHDSESSRDRQEGHAKAMHSTFANGFPGTFPPSCSRRICVSSTAVPAPRL